MSLLIDSSSKNKKCRLCLGRAETYINLFQGSFQQMISDLTSLEMDEDDGYPKIACVNCVDELQQAYNTRKRILDCHSKLKEMKTNISEDETQEKNLNYAEVVIVDDFSDDLADVDEINEQVSNSGFKDILSGYEDYVEEEDDDCRMDEYVLNDATISDSNDMTYAYEDDEKDFVGDSDLNQGVSTELVFQEESREFDNSMMETMRGVFSLEEKKKTRNKEEFDNNSLHCTECDIDFEKNKYGYYLHMLKHKKSKCKICGILIRTDNMSKHIENHTCGPRICDLCGTTCKNMESLRGHIFYMHRKAADEYKCDQCNRSFRMKYKLELHKKKEHIGVRSHVCTICSKGFFTVRDLNHHVKMTHLKLRPHICPHCKRGFSSKYAMKTHVRQHTNETPYKCYVCAEGFRQNVSLRTHLKSKHNIEEAKNFPCEFCEKAFSTEFALKVHLRLHSDDNYKCEHCVEYFQQKIFLVNHLKTVHKIMDVSVDRLFVEAVDNGESADS